MLTLSDSSGSRLPDEGYLTGFPLVESGVYCLSKTWPAPELPRPGCVWTHSLFIEFADLAILRDFASLNAKFRRPTFGSQTEYQSLLEFDDDLEFRRSEAPEFDDWARDVLATLYCKPEDSIFTPSHGNERYAQDVVLAIWSQQWPKLRRSFKFCSSVGFDRSISSVVFDLQIASSFDRQARLNVNGLLTAKSFCGEDWIELALNDLRDNEHELRNFLRLIGVEASGGRRDFVPLVQLYGKIHSERESDSISTAVRLVEKTFPADSGRRAKAVVVNSALDERHQLSGPDSRFVLEHWDLAYAGAISRHRTQMAKVLATECIDLLRSFLESPGPKRELGRRAISLASTEDLLGLIEQDPALMPTVLADRQDIMGNERFWASYGSADPFLIEAAAKSPNSSEILHAIVAALREDLAPEVVRRFTATAVLDAFSRRGDARGASKIPKAWLNEITRDGDAVAKLLLSWQGSSPADLAMLARRSTPPSVPNVGQKDPWYLAIAGSRAEEINDDLGFLLSFLFCRVLCRASAQPNEGLELTFGALYYLAWYRRFTAEAFNLLDHYLPFHVEGAEGTMEQRITAAAVEVVAREDLDIGLLARATENDRVFADLIRICSRTAMGRGLMRRLETRLRISDERRNSPRIRQLKKYTR